MFRPENSHRFTLLDPIYGMPVRQGPLPLDLHRPIRFVPGSGLAVIGIVDANNVRMTRLAQLGTEWTRPAAAKAHGAPQVLVTRDAIIVVEDGQFAIRRDRETGDVIWKRSLGPRPLNDAIRETALTPRALLSVSDGMLRSLSVEDGQPMWHRHLGSGSWRIHLNRGVIVCQPDDTDAQSTHRPITICDLSTGHLIQRLSAPRSGRANDLLVGHNFCCVHSEASLQGFVPFAD